MDALELCYLSAGELSRLIGGKEVSPVEVIDAHLARIDATEPTLNSFITLLPEHARAAAPAGGGTDSERQLSGAAARDTGRVERLVQHRRGSHHFRIAAL